MSDSRRNKIENDVHNIFEMQELIHFSNKTS